MLSNQSQPTSSPPFLLRRNDASSPPYTSPIKPHRCRPSHSPTLSPSPSPFLHPIAVLNRFLRRQFCPKRMCKYYFFIVFDCIFFLHWLSFMILVINDFQLFLRDFYFFFIIFGLLIWSWVETGRSCCILELNRLADSGPSPSISTDCGVSTCRGFGMAI